MPPKRGARKTVKATTKAAPKAAPKGKRTKVQQLYDQYANDPKDHENGVQDKIGPNGTASLLGDLDLEPDDRRVLVLVYHCKPEKDCEFSLPEFEQGMQSIGADSIDTLRKRLDSIDAGFRKLSEMQPVYNYTFGIGKRPGCRNLDEDLAKTYWQILFKDQWPMLPLWLDFVETQHKKPITKDTWTLLLDFAETIKADLSNFDEEASWPTVIDNFVMWAKSKVTA